MCIVLLRYGSTIKSDAYQPFKTDAMSCSQCSLYQKVKLTFCLHRGSFLGSSALASCWTTSFGVFTAKTSLIVDPITMIFAPFVTFNSRRVLSSWSSPLNMTFCMAGVRPEREITLIQLNL